MDVLLTKAYNHIASGQIQSGEIGPLNATGEAKPVS